MAAFSLPLKLNILVAIAAAVTAGLLMARPDASARDVTMTLPSWAYADTTILGMAAA